jgi:hypothetical protein
MKANDLISLIDPKFIAGMIVGETIYFTGIAADTFSICMDPFQ